MVDKPKEPKQPSFSTKHSLSANLPSVSIPPVARARKPLLVVVAVFVIGLCGGWLGGYLQDKNQSDLASSSRAIKQRYISDESSLISGIAKEANPSVVSVNVKRQVSVPDAFGLGSSSSSQQASGTGFIISSDGTIITNRHVVPDGTSSVSVTLSDGTTFDNVKVIGRTTSGSSLDVAFLKITNSKGKKLIPVTLGDSSKVQIGDRVVAIGNALGEFQNTVTSGIISGYGRDVTAGDQSGAAEESLTNLFQTDAAINEGNSGGPLMNINGEVIGINTAVASGSQNIGFAIPVNDIKSLISSVLAKGELQQPFLGVRYISLSDDAANQLKIKTTRGAYIAPVSQGDDPSVVDGSPAQKAGLKEKDVIIKVNGTKIDDKTSLSTALSRYQVGDEVTLTVVRGDQTLVIKATLAAAPQG